MDDLVREKLTKKYTEEIVRDQVLKEKAQEENSDSTEVKKSKCKPKMKVEETSTAPVKKCKPK